MATNVLSGWLSHIIVVIAGLIVPRMISDLQGIAALGVWDFGWATVKYLGLANLGVAAAVGRYVALHRASDNQGALGTAISTVLVWQSIISFVVLALIAGLVLAMPRILTSSLLPQLETIQWVVGLLSLALVIQMVFGPARGILTGYHRWGLNNAINAFSDISGVAGMVAVLYLGGGLKELAMVHLAAIVIAELARATVALALINDIELTLQNTEWRTARELIVFGAKSSLMATPTLFVIQTTNILLAGSAGPVALAVFSRPLSLASHIRVLVSKYSLLLTPMTGGIVGLGKEDDLAQFFIRSARTALLIAGPMLAVLAMDGDVILRLWMGDDFVSTSVPFILAVGLLLPSAMSAAMTILAGKNSHGKISLVSLASAVLAYFISWQLFVDALGWNSFSAALVVSISLTAGPGVAVLLLASRDLSVSVWEVVRRSLVGPLSLIAATAAVLWLPRYLAMFGEAIDVIIGVVLAALLYILVVWHLVLDDEHRISILCKVVRRRR